MIAPLFPSTRRTIALFLLAPALLALGACGTSFKRAATLEAPPTALAVDASNNQGAIRVVADPSISGIEVETDVHVAERVAEEERQAVADEVQVTTSLEGEPPRQVLRVEAVSPRPGAADHEVSLVIRAPSVQGVLARNRSGHIVLEGVGGAIQAESEEGSIEVRTDRRLDQPIALITTSGNILFKAPPTTQGAFELRTGQEGFVAFDTAAVAPEDVYASHAYWRGFVNDGANPVLLQSQTGSVRAWIREDPMALYHTFKD